MKTSHVSIRLRPEDIQHVQRWAAADPDRRGIGAVIRRLIREEVQRERERVDARDGVG